MPSPDTKTDPVDAPVRADVELLICSTCKQNITPDRPIDPLAVDAPRPGSILHARLSSIELPVGVRVRAVECLSNCSQGCTIAVRGPGRWTYVYGNIDPETQIDTVVDGVTRYAATSDGLVPWRERPQHFKKNCIARIPPIEVAS